MEIVKGHKIEYGTKGRDLSWQAKFPEEVECVHCGKPGARLAFVFMEEDGKEYASSLHDNDYAEGGEGFWLHDAAAFATYLCRDINCTGATTKWNQG